MTSAINDAIPVAGTLIDATAIRDNFVTAKSEVSALQTAKLAANGTVNPSANQPMAGFKHTGVAAASAAGQYIEYTQAYGLLSLGKSSIVNGNFIINQRNVSGTVTLAASTYGHDRWKAGAGGCTYTFVGSNGINTVTITAGTLMQTIRTTDVPIGLNTCVLSWTGTAQGRFGVGSYGASGLTATVSYAPLTVEFGTGTLSLVQLELGSVATPYEQRPFEAELLICQQYCRVISAIAIYQPVADGYLSTTTTAAFLLSFPTMRVPPVVTLTGWQLEVNFGTRVAISSVATSFISKEGCLIIATVAAQTANLHCNLVSTAAGSTIIFDAEL